MNNCTIIENNGSYQIIVSLGTLGVHPLDITVATFHPIGYDENGKQIAGLLAKDFVEFLKSRETK